VPTNSHTHYADTTRTCVLFTTHAHLREHFDRIYINRGFHPTQHSQRKERKGRKGRNEMTSLLDRSITAASDDGACRWHAANLWQTRHKNTKLLTLNLICIVNCTSKKLTKIWTIDFFLNLNLKQRV